MTKMTEISSAGVKLLSREFAAALKDLGDKYGVQISAGGGRYGGLDGEVRLRVRVTDIEPAKREFEVFAPRLGLAASDFGRIFVFRGTPYRITGINLAAPKYPVNAERVYDRKSYRFPVQTVTHGFKNAA